MPTQSPPPYELKIRSCPMRRRHFRWEVRSGGRLLLISHGTFRSRSAAEAEGQIELARLSERWQTLQGGQTPPAREGM